MPVDAYDFHCGQRVTAEDAAPKLMCRQRFGNAGLVGALRISQADILEDLFGPAVLYKRRIVLCTYERDTIPNHHYLYIVRMNKPKINDK